MTLSARRIAMVITTVLLLVLPMTIAGAHPSSSPPSEQGPAIANQYIVTVVDGFDAEKIAQEYRGVGAIIDHVYGSALDGFAGFLPPGLTNKLAEDPRIAMVEQDRVVTASELQTNATWGLDRIDQRALPLSGTYGAQGTGAGVLAYVLDTGVRSTHVEFEGRVAAGYDAVGGSTTEDCNGHGTHIAGTIGAATYGVAKAVTIVPVRVLRCDSSGSWSDVIEGIDWVTAHHTAGTPAVANLSIGGASSSSADAALKTMIADGVVAAAAAGNQGADACSYSPARVAEALTVAASTSSDQKPSWSNSGACVDLFAPGSGIASTWYSSDTATAGMSGTSMAAPHVAGAAALLLEQDPTATPATISSRMANLATSGVIGSAGTGTPNLLLYLEFGVSEPTNQAPTAAVKAACVDLTCELDGTGSSDPDGEIATYAWDFGDGASATGITANHTYTSGGTYTVTLKVTDNDGATSTDTTTVTVQAPADETPTEPIDQAPTAALTVTCDQLTCQLDGTGSSDPEGNIAAYAWDFGDGASATGSTASHTYATNGTYTITLTVTDAAGATATTTETVSVKAPNKGKGNNKTDDGGGTVDDGSSTPPAHGKGGKSK